MTARLAAHPDIAPHTPEVLERLVAVGMEVELVGPEVGASRGNDPLVALREGSIDLALVGIGALRGTGTDGLTTVGVLPRREFRDVLVTAAATPLVELPAGARVALDGARREAFLALHRPDLEAIPLLPSHVDAIRAPAVAPGGAVTAGPDALVLGALDARRHGLADQTVEVLDPRAWLPEPGQGAFALVARHPIAEATALDHLPTRTALRAELALLDALGVDHRVSLGCFAQTSGRWIRLWAAAASPDGARLVRSDRTGPLDEPEALGSAVAKELAARGFELVVVSAV